jgi:hypothetical protein
MDASVKSSKYRTPRVPIQTPMFDEVGNLTRTWVIFFERLGMRAAAAADIFDRTLLLKDTTVGNDIADHVTVYAAGTAQRIVGVLRKPITADLTVRVNLNATPLITLTISSATAIDTPVSSTAFTSTALADGDVLTWDVTASDGSQDKAGIASFTLEWK